MPRANAYLLRNLGLPKKLAISVALSSGLALFLSGWIISVTAINWGFSWMTVNQQKFKNYEWGGDLTGEQLCYHRNGVVKSRAFYDKGPVGCTVLYDETGQQTFPGPEGCPKPPAAPEKKQRMLNFSS